MGQLIGVTGYAKHGKDSTGKVLVEEFGFKRYAFADQLKSMALVLNPYVDSKYTLRLWQLVQDQGWDAAKENPEVRRFLQVLGTEAVRDHLGVDSWVTALGKRLADDGVFGITADGVDINPDAKVIITDVRFPNEAAWLQRAGGQLWRVTRLDGLGSAYDNGMGTDHPSERHIADLPADREIKAYTLDELAAQVRWLMANGG